MSRYVHHIGSYDTHASLYAEFLDPTLEPAAERLAELADARPGAQVLDLATGTGAVARAAARRGASVTGVDTSAGMLAIAKRRSPELDLRLANAGALPLGDDSFDAVTCGLSVSHFADRRQVFGEILRVLRAGGLFAASTWGQGGHSAAGEVGKLVERYVPPRAFPLDEETWFSPERGCDALREAGFTDVSASAEFFTGHFADAGEVLAWSLAWPLRAAALARLDDRDRHTFHAEAEQALQGADLRWRFGFNFYLGRKA